MDRGMTEVIFRAQIESTKKLLLLTLLDFADPRCSSIFPSIATLAARSSLSVRTVARHLDEFRQVGVLVATGRPNKFRPTEYKLVLKALPKCSATTPAPSAIEETSLSLAFDSEQKHNTGRTVAGLNGGNKDPLPIVASKKAPKIPAPEKETDPRLLPILKAWGEKYHAYKGLAYPSSFARDMKVIQRIMTPDLSVDLVVAAMSVFFNNPEEWNFKQRGAKLEVFLSRLPVLVEKNRSASPHRKTLKEMGYQSLLEMMGDE